MDLIDGLGGAIYARSPSVDDTPSPKRTDNSLLKEPQEEAIANSTGTTDEKRHHSTTTHISMQASSSSSATAANGLNSVTRPAAPNIPMNNLNNHNGKNGFRQADQRRVVTDNVTGNGTAQVGGNGRDDVGSASFLAQKDGEQVVEQNANTIPSDPMSKQLRLLLSYAKPTDTTKSWDLLKVDGETEVRGAWDDQGSPWMILRAHTFAPASPTFLQVSVQLQLGYSSVLHCI